MSILHIVFFKILEKPPFAKIGSPTSADLMDSFYSAIKGNVVDIDCLSYC